MRNVEGEVADPREHAIYQALTMDTSYVLRVAVHSSLRPPWTPNLMVWERVQVWADAYGGGP